MGLGLYDVTSPAEKALSAQANALGTMASQTKAESTVTKTSGGGASPIAKGLSGAATGAAAGSTLGPIGAIAGGLIGGLLSLFD